MKDKIKRALRYIIKGTPIVNIRAEISVIDPSNLLKDKSIIITGGGRGLGYYIAKKCVAEGANVLITGRDEKTLQQVNKELQCEYIACDVSQIEALPTFMKQAISKLGGKVDCLVNNAGISLHEKSMKFVTIEGFEKQLATNLKAPYFLSQLFLKHLEETENHNASIIFMASERGLYCDEIPYGLIKKSIVSLTQGMARRHIKDGIRVNAVAPGITASDMTGKNRDDNLALEYNCGGRVFLPEEVAETTVFLLSDVSKCISGEVIACDQGNYLRCDW